MFKVVLAGDCLVLVPVSFLFKEVEDLICLDSDNIINYLHL